MTFKLHPDKKKPKAALVLVGEEDQAAATAAATDATDADGWRVGTARICGDKVFLDSYFMFADKVSEYCLPIKDGDRLKFVLKANKDGRQRVQRAKLFEFLPRTPGEVDSYLTRLSWQLKTTSASRAALEALPEASMWKFLATEAGKSLFFLLRVVTELLRASIGRSVDAAPTIDALASVICSGDTLLDVYVRKGDEAEVGGGKFLPMETVFGDFLQEAIRVVPHYLVKLFPLFKTLGAVLQKDIYVGTYTYNIIYSYVRWHSVLPRVF